MHNNILFTVVKCNSEGNFFSFQYSVLCIHKKTLALAERSPIDYSRTFYIAQVLVRANPNLSAYPIRRNIALVNNIPSASNGGAYVSKREEKIINGYKIVVAFCRPRETRLARRDPPPAFDTPSARSRIINVNEMSWFPTFFVRYRILHVQIFPVFRRPSSIEFSFKFVDVFPKADTELPAHSDGVH